MEMYIHYYQQVDQVGMPLLNYMRLSNININGLIGYPPPVPDYAENVEV